MTITTTTWNRADHLLYGQRFISNPDLAAWIAGKQETTRPAPPAPLSPAAAAAAWLPDHWLDRLADDDDGDRYLSITARLTRIATIQRHFHGIVMGFIVPVRLVYPRGTPIIRENDAPTDFWRAWSSAIWATLPANDSEIFARTATTEAPKNSHLAHVMRPMLAWRKTSTPIRFDGTNWLQPDNDNHFDGEKPAPKPASNLERRMRPGSRDAVLKSFIKEAGPTTDWRHPKLGGGGDIEPRPVDIRCQGGVIVRAGRLHLANGETKDGDYRIKAGTILFQPDKFGELLGPESDHKESVRSATYWASLYKVDRETVVDTAEDGTEKPRFIRTGKMRRKEVITAEDRRILLAGPLPPVTYCNPGLPRGAEDFGSQFLGGWISQTKGKTPPERWEDISDEMARQVEFERWAAALPPEQIKALRLAETAANFKEIGEAFGKQDKNAERFGKKILVAANGNLKKVMAA